MFLKTVSMSETTSFYNTEGVWCKEKLYLIWFITCGTWMGFVFEAGFNMWFLMEQRLDDLGRWFIMWYLMDPTKGSNIMHVYVYTWLTAWCGQKSFAPATLLYAVCTFFPSQGREIETLKGIDASCCRSFRSVCHCLWSCSMRAHMSLPYSCIEWIHLPWKRAKLGL